MNPPSQPVSKGTRRRGMALIIVIGALALATMLLLAMFSLTESEYRSTQSYVAGLSAKQYSDTATAIVQAQIQNGQVARDGSGNPITNPLPTQRVIHATQPGMVRVYNANGTFKEAYKLYSSSQMKVPGPTESDIFTPQNTAPGDWDAMPARFVDLNEPVVRPSLGGGAGPDAVSVYYPVIDPRASYNFDGPQYVANSAPPVGSKTSQLEGFFYDKTTTKVGSALSVTYDTTKTNVMVTDPSQMRLPMPVEWIYFLQDGTMGTLNSSNRFITASSGVDATADNPIVARVAFWADDESCKININTASEPTFLAPPYYYHERDRRWANYPAAAFEYQRYPGHPATVALSTVLAPYYRLDTVRPDDDGFAQTDKNSIINIKEYIYNLAPKISTGGSLSGTVPFMNDDFSQANGETPATTTQPINNAVARAERLYASVDEMLFQDGVYSTATGRGAAKYDLPGSGTGSLFDHDTLERSRFFLTAHSRSPEFTMYGLPRVCMWPVADGEAGNNPRRTNFDTMIALCATLQNGPTSTTQTSVTGSYFFRRAEAHHATQDVTGSAAGFATSAGLQRNSRLLDYLVTQMSGLQWPETSSILNNPNYVAKYGVDNVRQLAVQFFDYIRCINLYDGVLARGNDPGRSVDGGALYNTDGSLKLTMTDVYVERDALATKFLTYTNQRCTPPSVNINASANSNLSKDVASDKNTLPGHGQVTPAIWSTNGQSYRGFGRMFTISEFGFTIICTADGKPDPKYGIVCNGVRSGGGTAFRADATKKYTIGGPTYQTNADVYGNLKNLDPAGKAVWWSNFPPLDPREDHTPKALYGTDPGVANGQNHPAFHPGYDPKNWNHTLVVNEPLKDGEKRIQLMLMFECFCPMLGWTKFHPEYTVKLDGNYVGQMMLNKQRLFNTTGDLVVKSAGNLYETGSSAYSWGGHVTPGSFSGNRGGRSVSGEGAVSMGADRQFPEGGNFSGHNNLSVYTLTSNFITVPRDGQLELEFPNGELVIEIYDKHEWEQRQPIQRIAIRLDDATLPTPRLVYNNYTGFYSDGSPEGKTQDINAGPVNIPAGGWNELNFHEKINTQGSITYRRSTQGPHWWVFNYDGTLGRQDGKVNPQYDGPGQQFWLDKPEPFGPAVPDSAARQLLRGRLDTNAGIINATGSGALPLTLLPPETVPGGVTVFESDVVRSMVPAVGDYRMIMARYEVPSIMWRRHPLWDETPTSRKHMAIHSFTGMSGAVENGVDLGAGGTANLLVADLHFGNPANLADVSRTPDLPPHPEWAKAANSFGDFDTGIANAREGPYVNKPDEGNFHAYTETRGSITKFYRASYFHEPWRQSDDWRTGLFMTPNRMISSPVMFGSLPTGVWDTGGNNSFGAFVGTSLAGQFPMRPWQTLLFRPYVRSNAATYGAKSTHPGQLGPVDHFLLDMFFMPVVEPYAISEPLSVAGRINMNYQIMPFTHIRRATGMNAVLKGEMMTAIPNGDPWNSKTFKSSPATAFVFDTFYDERTAPVKYWHRPINAKETLVQFDERFNHALGGVNGGLFRSASQICEIHLIPDVSKGASNNSQEILPTLTNLNASSRQIAMTAFWENHKVTGENIRERPYSNLYAKLTTRSNTFRVHVRAQVLKKARSTAPDVFDPDKDAVLSEYRGSNLIERYIDPSNTLNPIPDYAGSATPLSLPPLESFYQFRVIESKRFNP